MVWDVWNRHRYRQAGKFAKKSYRFDVAEAHRNHTNEVAQYWFGQGWAGAYGQLYVKPTDAAACSSFVDGWNAAQRNQLATE